MIFLYVLVTASVITEALALWLVIRNYRYVVRKYDRSRTSYCPRTALIIPCKGFDTEFEKNISSFYTLDYKNYELIFVTESEQDSAYKHLLEIKEKLKGRASAFKISVIVSGNSSKAGQKIHNQLFGCAAADKDCEVYAFADSDACVKSNWLNELIYPLRKEKNGVSSGYRWYVPLKNNFATIALSIINAKVAQLLGVTVFNHAWGGSMAVRVETFKKLQIEKIWEISVSDDLTISRAVKEAGLKVFFVPACFVASYEKNEMLSFLEFARRQFLITRIITPGTWLFGLITSFYSVFGFWGFLGLSFYFEINGFDYWYIYLLTALLSVSVQLFTAVLRQKMIFEIFQSDWHRLKAAAVADILAGPLWSFIILLCIILSSFGRKIRWRGITYKLISPTEVIRI
ncbi:MAG: N-glycosyltransferase [Planctomycetes bacterium ADurb.Bin401]|nr:MAG: N-glycosyltransferase [Planctomycetes bacterium ADurb.Bin401]